MSYKHLSIVEREKIAIYLALGWSICSIAKSLGRNKSTIWREVARNPGDYLPSKAQARYRRRRLNCRPKKKLADADLFALVRKMFLGCHWSPEQIANRLKLENLIEQSMRECSTRLSRNARKAIAAQSRQNPDQSRIVGTPR